MTPLSFQFDKKRVLIIGDPIIDEYVPLTSRRRSPEGPHLVGNYSGESASFPGGAAHVQWRFQQLGISSTLIGCFDEVQLKTVFSDLYEGHAASVKGCSCNKTVPKKSRVVVDDVTVIRIDNEDTAITSCPRIIDNLSDINLVDYSLIYIADYCKGSLGDTTLSPLLETLGKLDIPVILDSKSESIPRTAKNIFVKLNESEFRPYLKRVIGSRAKDNDANIATALNTERFNYFPSLIITLGKNGAILSTCEQLTSSTATSRHAKDVNGAGDIFGVVFAASLLDEKSDNFALQLATRVSSAFVSDPLRRSLFELILHQDFNTTAVELTPQILQLFQSENSGEGLVFTNGCFDLFHLGHAKLLKHCEALADSKSIVIAINSDESVRRLKGPERPILGQHARASLLHTLCEKSILVIFDDTTPEKLIELLPVFDIVKGGDYEAKSVVGATIVEERGGKVHIVELENFSSTSEIIERTKRQYIHNLQPPITERS